MNWQLFLVESDQSAFATYILPNGQTLFANRDLSVKQLRPSYHVIDLEIARLAIAVQSHQLIVFVDRSSVNPGATVNIVDSTETTNYRTLEYLKKLRIDSVGCYPTLTPAGGPGMAVSINTLTDQRFSLKWWDSHLGPYPTPLPLSP